VEGWRRVVITYKTKSKYLETSRQWKQNNRERVNKYKRDYYAKNKEKSIAEAKKYIKNNLEKVKERRHKYYLKNIKKFKEFGKQRYLKNKEEIKSKTRQWGVDNPEKVKIYSREKGIRYRKNPMKKLNMNISYGIWLSLNGTKKHRHWEDLVGYTVADLKSHLENLFISGMGWDNYGIWHVDHKIPKSAFNFSCAEDIDFKKCWALSNLQPMWGIDNVIKGKKLSKPFQPSLALNV
jgi:hypothetical protein